MQIRNGVFVIMFYGGRLFQQWIVDIYIKVESMRLDWHSRSENQAIIRADLYLVKIDKRIYCFLGFFCSQAMSYVAIIICRFCDCTNIT